MQHLCKPWEHRLSRRAWLGGMSAAGAAAASGLPFDAAFGEELAKQKKQVLFVWIDGGMSQYESWDPKPNSQFGGPFRPIQTSVPGIQVCELMPRSAKIMQHLCVVRGMCTQDNSHSAGVPRIQRGDPKNRGVTYPFFGSSVAKLVGNQGTGLPAYVSIKPGNGGFIYQDAGFLGPQFGAVAFGDGKPPENMTRPESITEADEELRQSLRNKADERYRLRRRPGAAEANGYVFESARELMRRQSLFDLSTVEARDRERYGDHEFGRHMLVARRMLEVGVTFVKVTSYGWDTHGDNFNGHASLMPRYDQAFASIVEDLQVRGMLDNVLVITMSEFGRTPRINGHVGRDHFPEAWSLALSGRGVKRGLTVGKTNAKGTAVEGDAYDIGHMFHTWFAALGIDTSKTQFDNHGQPLPIAHEDMHAVKEVLA